MNATAPPRVFAPLVPSRYDQTLRAWVPTLDLHQAEKFGKVVVMLQPDSPRAGPGPCAVAIREQMADFGDQDWIVCVGDPSLIGVAAAIAARKTGGILRLLKWDRMASDYIPVEVHV